MIIEKDWILPKPIQDSVRWLPSGRGSVLVFYTLAACQSPSLVRPCDQLISRDAAWTRWDGNRRISQLGHHDGQAAQRCGVAAWVAYRLTRKTVMARHECGRARSGSGPRGPPITRSWSPTRAVRTFCVRASGQWASVQVTFFLFFFFSKNRSATLWCSATSVHTPVVLYREFPLHVFYIAIYTLHMSLLFSIEVSAHATGLWLNGTLIRDSVRASSSCRQIMEYGY